MLDVEYLVAAPVRTRGRGKKATAKTENATEPSQGGVANDAATASHDQPQKKRRKRLPSISPVRAPKRSRLSAGDISPQSAYPRYREAVDYRRLGFFYIDHSTWVAQICDLETLSGPAGVDGWAIVRSEVDGSGAERYVCTCPDYKKYKQVCVHVLLLRSEDRPPFKLFSKQGRYLASLLSLRDTDALQTCLPALCSSTPPQPKSEVH